MDEDELGDALKEVFGSAEDAVKELVGRLDQADLLESVQGGEAGILEGLAANDIDAVLRPGELQDLSQLTGLQLQPLRQSMAEHLPDLLHQFGESLPQHERQQLTRMLGESPPGQGQPGHPGRRTGD